MTRSLFRLLGRLVVRHPVAVVAFFLVLAGLSLAASAAFLQLKTDQNDLVGADLEYNKRYLRFLGEFGDLEFIYVVIQVGEDPGRAMAVSDAVAAELRALVRGSSGGAAPLLESVLHRVPPEALRYGLPFRDYEDLRKLIEAIEPHAGELARIGAADSLAGLFSFFGRMLRPELLAGPPDDAVGGGGGEIARWGFRFLDLTLRSIEDVLAGARPGPLLGQIEDELGLSPRERGYLSTSNGHLLLVEVAPEKDQATLEIVREPLLAIRAAVDRVRTRFPDVDMGLAGRPVLQADEMMTTDRDMRFATCLALAGVLALFVLFFRRLRRPFFAVLALMVSIALTFGVVTVTYGYLTLLSIVFTAMLVGLGIDFGIHLLARYQDELIERGNVAAAIRTTLETTGRSIGTGAVTTAAAFYTILLVDFQGLRELGFIAGTGVLLCFASTVTLLPALIYLSDTLAASKRRLHPPLPVRVPFIDRSARRPRLTLALLGAMTAAGFVAGQVEWGGGPDGGVALRGLPYNPNLIDLQAQELESVRYEKLLIEESDFSTWFGAFIVETPEAVRSTLDRLQSARDAGIVGATESVLDYVPTDQERKILLFEGVWERLRDLRPAEPAAELDVEALRGSMDDLLDGIDGLASMAIARQEIEAAGELDRLSRRIDEVGAKLEALEGARESALASFQSRWIGELQHIVSDLRDALAPIELMARDLPWVLRRRLVSSDGGRYLVYAYPRRDIWEGDHMEEFVGALREVDPDVTGAPIQVYESSWRMHQGFLRASIYALCATLFFLVLDLRSLRQSLLAMVPLVLGLVWLLEVLPLMGLSFNLANFFALPILIGCGIDGGIHIVHRFRESRSAADVLRATCSAVTLSFLTTMAGFGAMSFAMHRGVRSLGLMMLAGLACILLASVVVLPALLRLIERRRERTLGEGAAVLAGPVR